MDWSQDEPQAQEQEPKHYYGDIVRDSFLVAAAVMLLGLPWFIKYLNIPLPISLVSMLALALAAGATSPVLRWTGVVNVVISIVGFLVFEWYAVDAYIQYSPSSKFFAANQVLAFVLLFSVYYSVKTVRGFYLKR
ncbi:MAG TPA: hypothetical protein VJK50_01915 [Patescibacteria group bacterium]|nr:hypothetical protein [Patescibacteria group bacterium]